MKNLTFITGNQNKADQLAKYLGIPVKHHKLDLLEIQAIDVEEVIEHKVKEAYSKIKGPVIVDDVSLIVNEFGRLPGTFIKWFASEIPYEKLCKIVHIFKDRSAVAKVAIGFYDGKDLKIFIGEITGSISDKPKGENGFGWDVVFIPDGYTKTRAQLEEKDYDKTSPRKMALEKLRSYLEKKK